MLFLPELLTINLDNNDVTELKFLDEKQLVSKLSTVWIKNNKRILVSNGVEMAGKVSCVSRQAITFRGNTEN